MTKILLNSKTKKGFTLVEMMIVVAIIAVLAGVAIPQYSKYVRKSETTEAIGFMKQIADGEMLYFTTHNDYVEFDTTTAGDTGPLKIGFTTPTDAKFTNYKVEKCGTDGIIIIAATTEFDAGKMVYSFFPASMELNAKSDRAYYNGNMFLQDYIDESTTQAAYRPQCP